jgi:chemotaxis protein histidine kinase CheA
MGFEMNKPVGDKVPQVSQEKLDAARTRMAELATRFLDRSDADLITMRGGLQRLVSAEAGAVSEIRHLAHRMVGTGATLGFEDLAECARRVEKLTESLAPGVLPDDDTRAKLASGLDALQAALDKVRRG